MHKSTELCDTTLKPYLGVAAVVPGSSSVRQSLRHPDHPLAEGPHQARA